MEQNDRRTVLHLLRNPWGWSDDVVREARYKAADELERLWRLEANTTEIAKELSQLVPNAEVTSRPPRAID